MQLPLEQLADEPAKQVRRYETTGGDPVFQIPMEVFPGFWAYAYLVLVEDYCVLIDTGSGFAHSNQHLEAGLKSASEVLGQTVGLADLTHVLITHGHIDHYGGLNHVRVNSQAKVGVHELDMRTLTHNEERLAVTARRLTGYLIESGVPEDRQEDMLQMYKLTKLNYQSEMVDFTYEATGMRLGPFSMLHVPGHCPGQVVIRLQDVLFSGDHVLSEISPHQAPERLTLNTGLTHYLKSLDALRPWVDEISLTLGGHNAPVEDLSTRLDEIQALHSERLDQVLELLAEPRSIYELSLTLFGEAPGYHVLLALEETGAHVEYLYQRGLLGIDNLVEYESCLDCVPLKYIRL